MSSSAVVQLVSKGVQDSVLTFNPQRTVFKSSFEQISNFSIEHFKVQPNNTFDYGKTLQVDVHRTGDMLRNLYVHMKVAALDTTATDFDSDSHFVNEMAIAFVKKVDLVIGTYTIDTHTSLQLAIQEEVESEVGKELGYAIGKSGSTAELKKWALYPQEFFMPLRFWFCMSAGQALPLVALQHHPTRIDLETRTFSECITGVTSPAAKSASASQGGITEGNLIAEYIFLDETERALWTGNEHDYLLDIWQRDNFQSSNTNTAGANFSVTKRLSFSFPVKELLVVAQPNSRNSTAGSYDYFNYEASSSGNDNVHKHPIVDIDVKFNNTGLQYVYSNTFAHVINNWAHHSKVPRKHIYSVPHSLYPEDGVQPSGSTNYSRIDTAELVLNVHGSMTGTIDFFVFARGHNVGHIGRGMFSLRYT